ncbi:sialate O-acetylesterase [Longitalea arenae]|uniref:sialate O-acetylesterase n=1 Tax=Longitalea arenae TaxID=2812558 RepID=UPI0019680288|nr:sialate O-acetylesterase [Longitalea arenae]
MKQFVLGFIVLLTSTTKAQLRLPAIFGDSMVLQRNAPVKIWGWAAPAESITVSFHGQQRTAKADANGNWQLVLSPEPAGGPYDLTVKGRTTITLRGILMGDLWLCSGQSNMEMPLNGWGQVLNWEQEIATADFPSIRLFTVEKDVQGLPAKDLKGGTWLTCTPQHIPPFSAVGYFFGRALHQQLKVPIGLINASWGGTDIESWISYAGFRTAPYYKHLVDAAPERSTAALTALKDQQLQAYLIAEQLNNIDTTTLAQWPALDHDDNSWRTMKVPELWESQQPGSAFDGVIWLRKEIMIDEKDAGKAAVLKLAMIDDNDVTYLNGIKVGAVNGYNVPRVYKIESGILKKGKNIIAVRVEDTGGGGGIHGDTADCSLLIDGRSMALAGSWKYRIESVRVNMGVGPNDYPAVLYNAMIHPLEKLAIKGVIWYQGENNAGRAVEYRQAMPLLINDWRKRWQQPAMPFYFVQLASYNAGNGNSNQGSTWAELREAQMMAASLPNSGMAVTIDVGDPVDIHPRNKQEVGKRLAALALKKTYGINTVATGPVYKSMRVAGSKIILQFINTGQGLMAKPASEKGLAGFEIAGADQRFYPAQAAIAGTTVIVSAPEVTKPLAVRYAWADDASQANLFNRDGLPAAPFRTDQWKAKTEGIKYTAKITSKK